MGGAAGGFAGGLTASGGDLRAAGNGAISGGIFGAIGAYGASAGYGDAQYVIAHAAGGCAAGVASGGDCGSAAAAAAFGKMVTLNTQGQPVLVQGIGSATAGGFGAWVAGGKFGDGFRTATFAYLFNQCISGDGCGKRSWNGLGPPPLVEEANANLARQLQGYLNAAGEWVDTVIFNKPPVDPPSIPPGWDGTTAPAPGWKWSGPDAPGGPKGGWVNPDGSQSLHGDFGHKPPIGPHVDWNIRGTRGWRIFPDGSVEPKK